MDNRTMVFDWLLSLKTHKVNIQEYSNFDWGPKPFRFNNYWLKNKGFGDVVLEGWSSTLIGGWKGVIVKEKLKALKGVLKRWNRVEYGGLEAKVEVITKEIERLDLKREDSLLDESDNETQKALFLELRHLLHSKDSLCF
jgi:hypothetical protein